MDFDTARFNMTEQQVRPWQVSEPEVLKWMHKIPRHLFVPEAYQTLAYTDIAIPLTSTAAMLPPKVVGRMLQALALKPEDEVLQIGTGTGYVTALIAKQCQSVLGLEIDQALALQTAANLHALDIHNVQIENKDAFLPSITHKQFDAIVFTGSMAFLPKPFLSQLSAGGRLFAFVGVGAAMRAMLVQKTTQSVITTDLFETSVPRLLNTLEVEAFTF